MQLRLRCAAFRCRSARTRRCEPPCRAGAVPRAPPHIRVAFQLPYRTEFGQRLRLVGSGVLGQWDIGRAVPMIWSAGDVWRADLKADLGPGEILRYKYVVCNEDGAVAAWKPGDDFTLRIPPEVQQAEGARLRILDTWDGAVHEVVLEVESRDADAESRRESADTFIRTALKHSYQELEIKLGAAQSLLAATSDPGAMELVLADRELAIAANKASALAKVVEASNQAAEVRNQKEQL